MTQQEERFTKQGNTLRVNLGGDANLEIDLARFDLDTETHSALEKAVSALQHVDMSVLTETKSPAEPYLSSTELEKIKGLKATLGATAGSEEIAGIICDFDLKCVKV